MRLTRYHLFLLGGLLVMVLGPLAFTQPGPGGKGERKGPPPDMMFVMMSGGNETFEVSKVQLRQWPGGPTVEQQREQMLGYLQKKGIKDGVMTKAVFPDYWEERMVEMRAMKEAKQRQTADLGAISLVAPPAPAQDLDAQGRDAFASLDTDKNGVLSIEEMQAAAKRGSRIYDERDRWDTNKNGTIELDEYLAYFRNRNSPSGRWGNGGQTPPADPVKPIEDDKRPTVYRTGKMPKELPAWFEEADKDKDGQVGLYEWKASGKSVSEFMAMDLNGDGFITAEEVLRHQRVAAKVSDSPSVGSSSTPSPTSDEADNPRKEKGKGRFNFGGRGKDRTKGG